MDEQPAPTWAWQGFPEPSCHSADSVTRGIEAGLRVRQIADTCLSFDAAPSDYDLLLAQAAQAAGE